MKILFVEDSPEVKIRNAIAYLNNVKKVEFSYELCKSQNSACKYIREHGEEVDLAVIDLGLPMIDDTVLGYNDLLGLSIIEFIVAMELDFPVIINSTTEVPDGWFKHHFQKTGRILEHVKMLRGEWLYNYLKENMSDKLIVTN